jgi:biotin transporter BioY
MKTVYLWAFVIASVLIGYALQRSNPQIAIYLLLGLVIWLWFEVSKLSDVSGKSVRDKYAKVIRQIEGWRRSN